MKISLLAAGSRGDVQPYVALGLALNHIGHTACIVTHGNYEGFVRSYGLEFRPVRGDVTQIASSEFAEDAMRADNPFKFALSFKKLQALAFDLQEDFFRACAGSDALVYHPGAAIAFFAAQQMQIPSILATPFPMTPTREYPALIFYNAPRLGKNFNWATHKIFERIMWFASSTPVKKFWQKEFGQLPVNFGNPYPRQTIPSHPTLVSCSDAVFPRPVDWPASVYNTGYWFLDDLGGWQPPASLDDFLRKGTPPVYVGFGSVGAGQQAVETTQLVIAALQKAGQRGVLATGWNGMSQSVAVPEEFYILESAPHSWLFPRMEVIIHHGGAGTTAAAFRSGKPSVVVPFSNDQFAWGRRVFELGVGSQPIPRKKLSVDNLAEAISAAMSPRVKEAANKLGQKIQSENGAENAALIIHRCLQG